MLRLPHDLRLERPGQVLRRGDEQGRRRVYGDGRRAVAHRAEHHAGRGDGRGRLDGRRVRARHTRGHRLRRTRALPRDAVPELPQLLGRGRGGNRRLPALDPGGEEQAAEVGDPVPEPLTGSVPEPNVSTPAGRGEYMTKVADCAGCHTPRGDKGEPLAGMAYGGGNPFGDGEGGAVTPTNLTPDATGISYYDEALFIRGMRTGHVGARQLSPHMPWWVYKDMTDEDLKSIFAYLRTLEPVEHRVDNTEKPTFCKICKQKHGLGERNEV